MTYPSAAVALLLLCAAPAAGQATFTPVDTGPWVNSVWAISPEGSFVVGWREVSAGVEAIRWEESSGVTGLGWLSGSHSQSSRAEAVSALGEVVVGTAGGDTVVGGSQNAIATVPYLWTPAAGMMPLPLPVGSAQGRATATNVDGSVVVGIHWNPTGTAVFRWTPATGTISARS